MHLTAVTVLHYFCPFIIQSQKQSNQIHLHQSASSLKPLTGEVENTVIKGWDTYIYKAASAQSLLEVYMLEAGKINVQI